MKERTKNYYNSLKAFIFPVHRKIISEQLLYWYGKDVDTFVNSKLKYNSTFFSANSNSEELYYYCNLSINLELFFESAINNSNFVNSSGKENYIDSSKDECINRIRKDLIHFKVYTNENRSINSIISKKNMLNIITNYYMYNTDDIKYNNSNSYNEVYGDSNYIKNFEIIIKACSQFIYVIKENIIPKLCVQWKEDINTYIKDK